MRRRQAPANPLRLSHAFIRFRPPSGEKKRAELRFCKACKKGWRKVATTSSSSQAQFDRRKLSSLRFSRGS